VDQTSETDKSVTKEFGINYPPKVIITEVAVASFESLQWQQRDNLNAFLNK